MKKLMMTILGVALGCASSLFAEGVINSQSYVSTDLVGQWDAIENAGVGQHSDSITAWKDLTGKTGDFSLRSDIASIEDSAIRKTDEGCMGSIDAEQRKDIRTIEVVVSEIPISAGYWIPTVFVSKDQNISMIDRKTNLGRKIFLDSSGKIASIAIPSAPATIVGLYDDATTATNCYQNGEILGPLNPDSDNPHWAQDNGRISLCGIYGAVDTYNGNRVSGHRVHAIRFYTRELTPAEIARNAFVDSIRFASNEVAEVSRCFLTDDEKAMVSVKVDIEKAQCCELSATVRDLSTGTTTESVLGTAADSNTHDYEITGLTFGRRYEVVIHGTWVFSAEQKVKMALRSLPVCVCDSLRYVQNGLVGQWDAIENAGIGLHSNGIASWSDLTGETGDFDLDVNIAEIGEQDIFKKGQGCLGSIDAPRRTDVKTIEAVISELPKNKWINSVFISQTQNVTMDDLPAGGRSFFLDNREQVVSTTSAPSLATVVGLYSDSATATNCYQNGEELKSWAKGTHWGSDAPRISLCGIYGNLPTERANQYYDYKIHAVRFYTRELTPDEIARHAFIDQLRFSPGGLATAKWSVTGDSKVKVYGTVNTLGGNAKCELSAICREGGTGVTTTNKLGTVSDSKGTFEYTFEGLDASKQYDIVLNGVWTMQADNSVTFASYFRAEAETIPASAQGYVQDCLVGQWDAIENAGIGQHSNSITNWVDLTGETGNFILDSSVATVEDSAILKTARGVMGTIKNTPRPTGVRTIEAVVSELPSSGWVAAVLITPNQTVTVNWNYNSKGAAAFFDNLHYGKQGFKPTSLMTVTGLYESDTSATNSYQNGGLMTGNDFNTHWSVDPGVISMGGVEGIPNSTTPMGYRIHAIRFYTRELTPAEIARNAFLDQLRFTGNGIAEVSRTVVGDNGEMRVAIAVNTLGGSSPCTLTALVRNRATGKMEEVPLANSVSDSALHEYTISNLDPSLNYEIVIHGSWQGGDFDLKTFDVSPEADAVPGTVYQVAASASATNAFDWVVAGSGLRRPPKAGDTVYVGLTNGTYQLLLSGAESKLIDLRAFAGAGMVGVTPKVTVQEGAVVSTRDGFAVGAATAGMTATGELLVSGGSLTAGGQGIVCAGGSQLVLVSGGTLSASKVSILDSDSVAKFRIIGSDADVTVDAADPSVAPKKGTRKTTPVFWDYRFDTTAVPGGPGVAPRKMSASDATVHGHFRLIPYGGFQLASTNVFPLVVHTGGAALVEGTAEGAKYDPLCTDLWSYTRNGSVLSAVLNPAYEMTNGVSRAEGLVRGYLKLPRIVNPANCRSATVRMKVEPADPEKKSLEDIVAAIREQYPDAQAIDKGGYNVEVPLLLDRLAKGESNKVVFDFSEFSSFKNIESGTVTTNAVVKAIAAEIKKPGIVLIVR